MSNLAQQFNDMDETHLAMSDPIELAKYIVELREENEQQFQNGFDAGREEYQVDQEFLDEKDDEIKKLKEENKVLFSFQKEVDQMETEIGWSCDEEYQDIQFYELPALITKLYEENKKLKDEIKKLKEAAKFQVKQMEKDADNLANLFQENEKLKKENHQLKLHDDIRSAELDYIDPKAKYICIDDYEKFNEYLKSNYSEDRYKEMYEEMDMDCHLGIE